MFIRFYGDIAKKKSPLYQQRRIDGDEKVNEYLALMDEASREKLFQDNLKYV